MTNQIIKREQQTVMIAYQGEPGSFSEQAARKFFGTRAHLQPVPAFSDVFGEAERRPAGFGIVPIENSLFGSIHQVYDLLLKHNLFIIGEVKLRIELHLMALPETKRKSIRTIYSQLQAIGQCEHFLSTLHHVKVEAVHDTAAAARFIQERKCNDAAAIASEQAARVHGLHILKRNIESSHRNFTRFIALSRKPVQPSGNVKTSLVFAVKDIPGALFKALAVFALRDINMLKVESRPIIGKPWEYLFYVDVEGTPHRGPLHQALHHLEEVCTVVRVLGSYRPYNESTHSPQRT
jgi:prephenate dehydratase